MSAPNQANMSSPWPGATPPAARGPVRGASASRASIVKTFFLVVACGLLVGAGLAYLAWHNRGQRPSADSELRADQAAAPVAEAPAAPAPPEPKNRSAATTTRQQYGAGGRYRVAVETAYFFDVPEQQSTPNGRYLRRGDVFYGEGETNGFVKTAFVQPNGSAGTGWLKRAELSKLTAGSASRPAASTRSGAAARPAPAAPATEAGAAVSPAGLPLAVVQVERSYFYDSPDLALPRKAHCVRGDKVRLGETQGPAVYVTFTNWEKVTTSGWMRRDALQSPR